jgi:putative phosphoesterase
VNARQRKRQPDIEQPNVRRVGLISDTHGLLRPEAIEALRGSELIVHAGDVGDLGIVVALGAIAPVVAVRGNVDTQPWAAVLPATAVAQAGSVMIYVLHNIRELDLDPRAAGFHIVVSGHSHQWERIERDGVLYINPGSAGPRRFSLPITLARLDVGVEPWNVEFVDLGGG